MVYWSRLVYGLLVQTDVWSTGLDWCLIYWSRLVYGLLLSLYAYRLNAVLSTMKSWKVSTFWIFSFDCKLRLKLVVHFKLNLRLELHWKSIRIIDFEADSVEWFVIALRVFNLTNTAILLNVWRFDVWGRFGRTQTSRGKPSPRVMWGKTTVRCGAIFPGECFSYKWFEKRKLLWAILVWRPTAALYPYSVHNVLIVGWKI